MKKAPVPTTTSPFSSSSSSPSSSTTQPLQHPRVQGVRVKMPRGMSGSRPPQHAIKQNGPQKSLHIGDWVVSTTNTIINNSEEMTRLEQELDAPLLPEMVFGRNRLDFHHIPSGFVLRFDANGALRKWRQHCEDPSSFVHVAYAQAWQKERKDTVVNTPKQSYDWTFTPKGYYGEVMKCVKGEKGEEMVVPVQEEDNNIARVVHDGSAEIDYTLLKGRDPFIFYEELVLFEDELADNGSAMLTAKVRVMPSCFFALVRFAMRVDDVLFRIIDTRVFHRFQTPFIVREISNREATYEALGEKLPSDRRDFGNFQLMYDILPVTKFHVEAIVPTGENLGEEESRK